MAIVLFFLNRSSQLIKIIVINHDFNFMPKMAIINYRFNDVIKNTSLNIILKHELF